MKLYQTADIYLSLPEPEPLQVDQMVRTLKQAETKELISRVKEDLVQSQNIPDPDYQAGKMLYKQAVILDLAKTLKLPEAIELQNKLEKNLIDWFGTSPGVESKRWDIKTSPYGLVAKNPQFGNENFNDHHFHYGYFLAAVGLDAKYNPSILGKLQPTLQPMIQDIGNTDPQNQFPLYRGFDPYEGHSWASGNADFADGNNQESTSEAINRWYGLYLAGKALGRNDLIALALTGWAMEQESARIYWLGQKPEIYAFPDGFTSQTVSILWGGKLDHTTWFNDRPTFVYGIQFLPITPAMTHLVAPKTWQTYTSYQFDPSPDAWNDIHDMVAVTNGQKVPEAQTHYEEGNPSSWYYLWVKYWTRNPGIN